MSLHPSADAVRLHQVVWNLLTNAQKFTEAGGRIVLRTFSARPGTVTLERAPTRVPATLEAAGDAVVPFHAGETLGWRWLG